MAMITAERTTTAKPISAARERYVGWLDGRVTSSALYSNRIETLIDFSGGWAELRRLIWSRPMESVWQTGERCYLLSLALDGADETDRRNEAILPVRSSPGRRVLLVPPEQTINSSVLTGGRSRLMRCILHADLVEAILGRKPSKDECTALGTLDFGGGAIEWLLCRMYRELSSDELGVAIAVESLAREIAVEIARTIDRRRHGARRRSGGLPAWRMRLLIERIHDDGPLPKVVDLAEICGMTARHLGRAFQAETGKTIGKFITAAMAERARTMLEAGAPVGSVAMTLGYSSSSSFAHAFHRETGVLPSGVRQGAGQLQ